METLQTIIVWASVGCFTLGFLVGIAVSAMSIIEIATEIDPAKHRTAIIVFSPFIIITFVGAAVISIIVGTINNIFTWAVKSM